MTAGSLDVASVDVIDRSVKFGKRLTGRTLTRGIVVSRRTPVPGTVTAGD
jgi:hypothetical protein